MYTDVELRWQWGYAIWMKQTFSLGLSYSNVNCLIFSKNHNQFSLLLLTSVYHYLVGGCLEMRDLGFCFNGESSL